MPDATPSRPAGSSGPGGDGSRDTTGSRGPAGSGGPRGSGPRGSGGPDGGRGPRGSGGPGHSGGLGGPGALALLRQIVLMVGATLVMLLIVLWFVLDGEVTAETDSPVAWILVGAGTVASIVGVRIARDLPLRAGSTDDFIGSLRTGTFLGVAFAELPALLGFVAAFLEGAMWPYLVGLVPAAIGLGLILPTRQRLHDLERRLRSRGLDIDAAALLGDPRSAAP